MKMSEVIMYNILMIYLSSKEILCHFVIYSTTWNPLFQLI